MKSIAFADVGSIYIEWIDSIKHSVQSDSSNSLFCRIGQQSSSNTMIEFS